MSSGVNREHVSTPVPATALIVDLRNFTPNLNASTLGPEEGGFCRFLAEVYGDVLTAARVALPPAKREADVPHVTSTGDGALVIFRDARHPATAFLAALLLDALLGRRCAVAPRQPGVPAIAFGIGVESGAVTEVAALAPPGLRAFLGNCVNVAARIEAVTKTLDRASTLLGDALVERASELLFGRNFGSLRAREAAASSDAERVAVHDEMNRLNHDLCVAYVHRHVLKGVDRPLPIYRLARSAVQPGVPRFEALLDRLVDGDVAHRDDVRTLI
jgi:class 3 adenylate cyclase